ncbi:type I-F CRISPR-associated protein Csy2 [Pseudorhodoferax sp.]|uniref:type I-F CRISPR-associated protein Csy2 n=1 Tax=Pseudorhodoferax sp. TaxID=1993553 RepID=UPI0039E6CE11
MATAEPPVIDALLVLPRLRIQNANAISSPLTWGFPAISGFLGLMQAVQRKLPADCGLRFVGVGVVCHDFQAQTTGGYTRQFNLTRNPVKKNGSTAAIVEEGRIHLDLTLVFGVRFAEGLPRDEAERQRRAAQVAERVAGMRVAGGSVVPPLRRLPEALRRPRLVAFDVGGDAQAELFRQERRRWLPGFALVSRDDLLASHLALLRRRQPQASLLDAWLDLSRLNLRAEPPEPEDATTGRAARKPVAWRADRRPGWLVPMPVGYGALSELHPPGSVARARDRVTPFRFVESLYGIGQWISPHRLQLPTDLLWTAWADPARGLYRCVNHFVRPATLHDEDVLLDEGF